MKGIREGVGRDEKGERGKGGGRDGKGRKRKGGYGAPSYYFIIRPLPTTQF